MSEFVTPLSNQARRMLIDSRQLFEAFAHARNRLAGYSGGMTWRKVSGGEYLIRILNSHGAQKSLGPRAPETEAVYDAFVRGKAEAQDRLKSLRTRVDEQARLNKAVGLGHLPVASARILRELDARGLLGRNVIVAGTNALYAYEGLAGVRLAGELMETGDLNILWEARMRLVLTTWANSEPNIIAALKAVDPSFEIARRRFTAVSKRGFEVDLIRAESDPPWAVDDRPALAIDDLMAAPIRNLAWLVNAPKVETVVIDERGYPVPIAAPDPRAFAVYKVWMARNDPERDPVKRPRDLAQAMAVAELVREHLPNMPMQLEVLRKFPKAVVDEMPGDKADEPFWSPSGPGF